MYILSLNLESLVIIMLLIIVIGLGLILLEQVIAKRYVNQGRRRVETAVIIQKGHRVLFF